MMYPLSKQQLQFWIDWQLDRNNPRHNTHVVFEITGDFDPQQFLKAFNDSFKDCPIFHTCFCIQEGTPFSSIEFHNKPLIQHIKLKEAILDEHNYIEKIIREPFDLLSYPNFRALLLEFDRRGAYYFITIFPHILMDAKACQLLLKKLSSHYNGARKQIKIVDESVEIANVVDIKLVEYWEKKLSRATLALELSSQYTSSTQKKQKRIFSFLKGKPVSSLKQFSKENKTTPFLVLLSLFAVILYRYTSQTCFSIIYPVDLRGRGHKKKIGCYSNFTPMCIEIEDGGTSLREFITYITQQRKKDRLYQNILFSELCQIIQKFKKKPASFNVGFSQTLFAPHDFQLGNAKIKNISIPIPSFSCDFGLLFDIDEDKLIFALDYDSGKFCPSFAKQLLSHVENTVNALPLIASEPIDTFDYLGREEMINLMRFSNVKSKKISDEKKPLLLQLHNVIKRYPEKIALSDRLGSFSYQELQKLVNRIINLLKNEAVLSGNCVGILLNRDRYYIATIVALMSLGCPYIPLEVDLPISRINLIFQDANCQVLVTEKVIDIQSSNQVKQLLLKNLPEEHQDVIWNYSHSDNNIAYIIYTSGTTGKPKGVPTKHKALLSLLTHALPLFTFSPEDRWSLSHSLAFDFSVWEMWGCFLNAAQLVIISNSLKRQPKMFYQAIAQEKITVFCQTPSAFKQFMALDDQLNQKLYLRYVIFGGEKLEPISLSSWVDKHDLSKVALINMYGLTEAPIHATFHRLTMQDITNNISNVGKPLPNMKIFVLDKNGNFLPPSCLGEIILGGDSLTDGYINNSKINAERFIVNRLIGENVYKTGDYGRWTTTGDLVYVGRKDQQVKYLGHRIELSEIHYHLQKLTYIDNAVTIPYSTRSEQQHLITFCVVSDPRRYEKNCSAILSYLGSHLPEYMLPADLIFIKKLPLTNQGKINTAVLRQKILKKHTYNHHPVIDIQCLHLVERAWKKVLNLDNIDKNMNFFDQGGSSITLTKLHYELETSLGLSFPLNILFNYSTITDQVNYFSTPTSKHNNRLKFSANCQSRQVVEKNIDDRIAIVGMAVKLPKASSLRQFWENLLGGVESITDFSSADLLDAGIEETLINSENYVSAKGYLEEADLFDANFFEYSEKEAAIIDPQQRLFLTCCWLAFEDAGWVPEGFSQSKKKTSIFGSQSQINSYLMENLLKSKETKATFSPYQIHISNAVDFLCSRVSYKLGLTGSSMAIQSGCSSSLVAVCEAAKSLMNNECDLALAGGSTISMPLKSGYLYQPGMILSRDGHCRAFDKDANGTVPSNGVAVVALRRMKDAIADRDRIYAVIRGSSVNNDGSKKLGFTAPSQSGQAKTIQAAFEKAGVDPCSIDYIEAHGTGTKIGDPIELAALDSILPRKEDGSRYHLGSLKTNLGHLDVTAGVVGLIKTALCLYHKKLVPSLHFQQLNDPQSYYKKFNFVNKSSDWIKDSSTPRRAGVSSFAIGGTNAHVVMEESPLLIKSNTINQENLFVFSAKTPSSLANYLEKFYTFLKQEAVSLNDIAFTLQVGRYHFPYRFSAVATSSSELASILHNQNENLFSKPTEPQSICFVFAGQGVEYFTMGNELYQTQPCFRKYVDECAVIILELCQKDIRTLNKEEFGELNQLCIFSIEYALAKTLMEWGVLPNQVIGYSLGELVALCVAGTYELKEALTIVNIRQSLMRRLPKGKMLSVSLSYEEAKTYCGDDLSVAAINAPKRCVISGSSKAIEQCAETLKKIAVACQIISTKYAYHSAAIDAIVPDFIRKIADIPFKEGIIDIISTATGTILDDEALQNSCYWSQQLREPVLFFSAVKTALKNKASIFIEIGSASGLCNFIKQIEKNTICLNTLYKTMGETRCLLKMLRELWLNGESINWNKFNVHSKGSVVSLPPYCFDEKPYWVFPDTFKKTTAFVKEKFTKKRNVNIYQPIWIFSPLLKGSTEKKKSNRAALIIFSDTLGIAQQLCQRLKSSNNQLFVISSDRKNNYLHELSQIEKNIDRIEIIHAETLNYLENSTCSIDLEKNNFIRWISLLSECAKYYKSMPIRIILITKGLFQVLGNETLEPEKGLLLGSLLTLQQENEHITCKIIDVFPVEKEVNQQILSNTLLEDIESCDTNTIVAYRHFRRFTRKFSILTVPEVQHAAIKPNGVYLITGGLGHIGLNFAKTIASQCTVNLLLLQRQSFPKKIEWHEKDFSDEVKNKIARLESIERSGSRIEIIECDITNTSKVNATVRRLLKDYQTIDGVVHAAGVSSGTLIANVNMNHINEGLAPKVDGILNLHNALKNIDLEFMVLCSALSAIQGSYAQGIYNAANSFLDIFAYWRTQSYGFTVSINWDAWKEGGMAYRFFKSIDQLDYIDNGLEDEEASFAILASLEPRYSQFIVSHAELDSEIEREKSKTILFPSSRKLSESLPIEEVSEKMLMVWKNYLGEGVTPSDNYFELGGDSLLAVQMMQKISQEYGVKLEPSALLVAPTVEKLSQKVLQLKQSINEEHFSPIVTLKKSNTSTPVNIFLIHPIGGTVYIYKSLADTLAPQVSCYSIQTVFNNQLFTENHSVINLATDYLKAIQPLKSEVPCYFGGFSFGGMVAYEMAQQCYEVHQTITGLMMIDTPSHPLPKLTAHDSEIIAYLLKVGAGYPVSDAFYNMELKEQLNYFVRHSGNLKYQLNDSNHETLKQYLAVFKANLMAAQHYKPLAYRQLTPVYYFKAEEQDSVNPVAPEKGWGRVISEEKLIVSRIPGNHLTMMESHNAANIANIINRKVLIL